MTLQNFFENLYSANGVIAISSFIMAVSAFLGLFFQLKSLLSSVKNSNLLNAFNIEFELNKRKNYFAKMRFDSIKFVLKEPPPKKEEIEISEGNVAEARQGYLNIFDRMCYFILKGLLNEELFRIQYKALLSEVITLYEDEFGEASRYINMLNLNERWQKS